MDKGMYLVFKPSLKKESDRKAQLATIQASKALSDIVRTTLGPRSMLKMLLDPMGGIVITNDGNSILREIDVNNPGAKSLIELSRSLDEEVGDGTTSCVILCGELLSNCASLIKKEIHPTEIIQGLMEALDDALKALDNISIPVNINDHNKLLQIIQSSLSTKFSNRWGDLISKLALDSIFKLHKSTHNRTNGTNCTNGLNGVSDGLPDAVKPLDIKRLIKVEKIIGGYIEDSKVLDGVVVNKDVVHANMSRRIENPRILILDCTLEYKKGESQTMVDIYDESVWNKLLLQEETEIKQMCQYIINSNCNLVVTEKGVSDLAQHYLVKAGISCLRRVRKSDTNRISKACGATIVNRPEEITESDIGHRCKLFHVDKIGDEYYSFFDLCTDPKACSILLRGSSKDVLNEIERNLYDALSICRNIIYNCKLLPGGGATEVYISNFLNQQISRKVGLRRLSYECASKAFQVIPKTLAQNCGVNPSTALRAGNSCLKLMSDLLLMHGNGEVHMGINGETGQIINVVNHNLYDIFLVKSQIYKSSFESVSHCLLCLYVIEDRYNSEWDREA
eukprot:XP_763724.1 T-complex protein 1 subunit gamma [Theileria parva strain Muguga]